MTLQEVRPGTAGPGAAPGLRARVLADGAALEQEREGWDALAVAAGRPYSAPGWALPWWRSARPPGSELAVVTVHEGSALVGLAPCYVGRTRSGLTTARLVADVDASYSEPLATAARRRDVAAAVASALADRDVDVLSLENVPADSPWPDLLRETWPGRRPHLAAVSTVGAPCVDLPPGGPEAWFEGRSRNFRQQVRRRRREFGRLGGRLEVARTHDDALAGLREFVRLHHGRWANRGGSQALHGSMPLMLQRAVEELGPGRLQVWTATADGDTVAAALFVAAGPEMHYWLGGFDEAWAPLSPSLLLLVAAVLRAPEFGCRRISLGPGVQPYKARMATGEDELVRLDLLPRTRRYPYVLLRQAPYRLRRVVANHTPPETRQRLRQATERLRPTREAAP
ncbi:Acetyltransferase involved in cellulose biosynthesis, CelD/BcsL family [Blastococcus fimeti]|nr:Acetyltransferase involved in cellulose biosynthesis, CelD/BcsL family [Blastococcus fimeti]